MAQDEKTIYVYENWRGEAPTLLGRLRCGFCLLYTSAAQKPRYIKCPYCQHNSIVVYEDTRGHVEKKCNKCGKVTVFDVLSMRKIVFRLRPK